MRACIPKVSLLSSVFDHPWLGGLFADAEMAALWSPEAQLEGMRAFEVAWSRALGRAGLADAEQAGAAAAAIAAMEFDLAALRAATARDGVIVPEMVRQMKLAAGPAQAAVHQGATSQDVIDSALAIAIAASLDLMAGRLRELETALRALSDRQGARPLMGRTRMQAATMITVADRIRPWVTPLADHIERLWQLHPRVARVQIGGASGDRKALGDAAGIVVREVAAALDLSAPPASWHARRDGVAEFAGLLSLITGTLGKMGQDIALMAQQGIEEIGLSGGGASSAMPHKQNPVQAELLVTLARFNAGSLAQMHQALVHEQERSGAAWVLEWMVLPQMAQTTGRALSLACSLVASVNRLGRD